MKKLLLTAAAVLLTAAAGAAEKGKALFRYRAGEGVHAGRIFTWDGDVRADKEGIIQFPGKGCAIPVNSRDWNITEKGYTITMTFRLPKDIGAQDLFAFLYKDQSIRINRFRLRGLYANVTPQPGTGKNQELKGGNLLPLGEWVHFAFTAEYINDTAQGNVGYVVRYYINGELIAERMLRYFKPSTRKSYMMLGKGNMGASDLRGEIASFAVYDRCLSEAEIVEEVIADGRAKLFVQPGSRNGDKKIAAAAAKITAKAVLPEAGWLAGALAKADTMTADIGELTVSLQVLNKLAGEKSLAQLVKKFNAGQKFYRLILTPQAVMLIVSQKGLTNPPIVDIYNRAAGCGTFAGRAQSWEISCGKTKISDYSEGISYQIKDFKETSDGAQFTVKWQYKNLTVDMNCVLAGGRFTSTLSAVSADKAISDVRFPVCVLAKLPGKDILLVPHQSGQLYANAASGCMSRGIYPSAEMTLGFISYYNDHGNGIYFAAEDPDGCVKNIAISGKNQSLTVDFSRSVAVKDPAKGSTFTLPGRIAMEFFNGDWFDAGQLYKKFLMKEAYWFPRQLPRTDSPEWYLKNTMWLRGPYRWDIDGKGKNFTSEPYMFFLDYFGLPYSLVGGRPLNYTELHKKGFRVKVYTNVRLWNYTPAVNISSPNAGKYIAMQESPEGKSSVVVMANGAKRNEMFGGIMWNVGCPTAAGMKEMRRDISRRHFKNNFVSSIYHDQLNSAPEICYSDAHGHAPGDPTAWVRGNREFLTWFREQRKERPYLAQDGEDSSEIYADLVDGIMPWRYVHINQVPLFQSIYSGGRMQFTGRSYNNALAGDEASWYCKAANQLTFGEQIGWFRIEEMFKADMKRVFIKKLMHLRYGLLGYFNASDMLRPLKFKGSVPKITSVWGGLRIGARNIVTDKIQSSAWRRIDGNIMVVFVNTVNEKVKVQPDVKYPGKLTVCREGASEVFTPADGKLPAVELAPYACEVWFFGNDTETPAALQKKLAEFPSYTPGEDVGLKIDPKALLM